jgi:uncharacterized protein YbjT (DUF2867 family)
MIRIILLSCYFVIVRVASGMSTSPLPNKVAVTGATGRLGREAVQQLVQRGVNCKLLVRSTPSTAAPYTLSKESSKDEVIAFLASLKGVELVQGDIGNAEALRQLLKDCQACLALHGATRRSKISDIWNTKVADTDPSHAKQVNYQGVNNLIEAARETGCKRIVRITGKGEDPKSFFSVLINMLGSMAKAWNYEGERLLRGQTEVDYTIIRPGVMSDEGPEGNFCLADDGGDLKVSRIRYSSVASLCIDCLQYPNTARSTLTAMTCEGGASSYAPLLEKVAPDRRYFPSDMFQQHQAAVRKALLRISTATALTTAVLVQWIIRKLF